VNELRHPKAKCGDAALVNAGFWPTMIERAWVAAVPMPLVPSR